MRSSFKNNISLKKQSTLGIGGNAKYFIEAQSVVQLQEIIRFCFQENLRYLVLGKGSNVLFDDRGFDGVVILNKIQFIEENEGEFYVGAGYSFSLLGAQTAKKGWEGLEFASGIPGSVGGAVFMNAGANGSDTFETVQEVTFINERGEVEFLLKDAMEWRYRWTSFHEKKGAIVAARFLLKRSDSARARQLSLIDYRTKTQPYSEKSAGCVFRNSEKEGAGALIERCGLKGARVGGAEVSLRHANFIVNKGDATAADVLALAAHIQKTVHEKTDHFLEMEIRKIDFA
jgi:UDP-N-acetylmuramate dehydrogenase